MGTLPKAGGFGADNLHCFSLLTYSPPYPLSICQSIPTEFTLQAAFGFKLKTFNDVQEEGGSSDFKRKRRSPKLLKRNKRQSDALVYDFFDRETFTGEVPNTKDSTIKKDVEELVGKASTTQLQNANLGVLGGEQFPICVSKMGRMIQLNPVKIKSGTDKDPKPASDCTSIITTPRPDKEVLNNDPIPESGVAKTTTTTTTTTTSVTTSTTTTSLKTSTINGRTIDEKTSTTTTTTRVDRKNDEAKVVPMTENIGAVIVPKFNLGFITISAWILYLL